MAKKVKRPLKINLGIKLKLEEALKAARLDACSVNPEAQHAMELYLMTWVVAPLASALEQITGVDLAEALDDFTGEGEGDGSTYKYTRLMYGKFGKPYPERKENK